MGLTGFYGFEVCGLVQGLTSHQHWPAQPMQKAWVNPLSTVCSWLISTMNLRSFGKRGARLAAKDMAGARELAATGRLNEVTRTRTGFFGFGIWGLGFGVWGLGCGCRV